MTIRRSSNLNKNIGKAEKIRQKLNRDLQRRRMLLEGLEDRRLMAVGPRLIGIQPNNDALLSRDRTDIRNVAPLELIFRFDENQRFNANNLNGIQITRSGSDHTFAPARVASFFNTNTSDPAEVTFEARQLGTDGNNISLSFTKSNLGPGSPPIVTVSGTTINVRLNNTAGSQTTAKVLVDTINSNVDASRLVRGRVTAGNANRDITTPAINYSPLRLTGANDQVIRPGFIGPGDAPNENEIIVRFAEALPDDLYHIDVFGEHPQLALRNTANAPFGDIEGDGTGADFRLDFELDLGPQIVSVVPQPVERIGGVLNQRRDTIVVYFNNDDLLVERDPNSGAPTSRSAENPDFYQLIYTNDTVENTDDITVKPVTVTYDPITDSATLRFAADLDRLSVPGGAPGSLIGPGTFRLRVGTDEPRPLPPINTSISTDPGSSFRTSFNVGGLGVQGQIFSQNIDPQLFPISLPGSNNEPGHRDIDESHVPIDGADSTTGITTIEYNFRSDFGLIPDIQGGLQPAFNLITSAQRQRAREVLEIYGKFGGVKFVETERDGLTIATGDLRAVLPRTVQSAVGGTQFLVGTTDVGPAIVMDSAETWSDGFGQNWFSSAVTAVGFFLGLGPTNDLPPTTAMGSDPSLVFDNPIEPIFPGDHDIVHLQHLYRPESKDIDFYRFEITESGRFTAETIAERLSNSSLLNTTISLYRDLKDGAGVVVGQEFLARNDDYYSKDSFIGLDLTPGTYYLGVSASGNEAYDPAIEDSGFGGTSQGRYDLRLNFRPVVARSIVDVDNASNLAAGATSRATSLDGDLNGQSGGEFNFWFRAVAENRSLQITGNGFSFVDGQTLTITNGQGVVRRFEFDSNGAVLPGNIPVAFTKGVDVATSSNSTQIATSLVAAISGQSGFNVSASLSGNRVVLAGERNVTLSSSFVGIKADGKTIFVDKSAVAGGDGSRARPFNNLANPAAVNAVGTAQSGDIIRVIGNDSDSNPATLADRQAYEIGFNSLGQTLADGATLDVPQGVTLMIDAGAVFKIRRARLGVGSSATGIDRSKGAIQVLGTPFSSVFFTSYHDESIGRDTFPFATTPQPGDWGGLVFRDDTDRADGNFVYDEEGIFLNYVNHADLRYGGGNVVINSLAQVINPVHIIDSRPTITFNSITNSADAAMSASPNSFEETNFHAPRHQRIPFTADYSRVGPDIHGNHIVDNTTNGLFVRIATPAGNDVRRHTVSGRWDDIDIVHVIGENLSVVGTPGGPTKETSAPQVNLITQTPVAGGSLTAGSYSYKLVFLDPEGNEGLASAATPLVTLVGGSGFDAIRLAQLPTVNGGSTARRLYRSRGNGPFELVTQLNGNSTTYFDDGATRGGSLLVPATGLTNLTAAAGGSLATGSYNYRITFVDAFGNESTPSDPTPSLAISGNPNASGNIGQGQITLANLPAVPAGFIGRRIYRSSNASGAPYGFVGQTTAAAATFVDSGMAAVGRLENSIRRPRLDARLSVDPAAVVKMDGARIDLGVGAQMIAEGVEGLEIKFTGLLDDRYGAGGSFDTSNDDDLGGNEPQPRFGDWGGIYAGHNSTISLDQALIAYGGGVTRVEGSFAAFNPLEIHQADARVTNSVFEFNAEGQGGQSPADRFGRGFNEPAAIFIRAAQPVLVDNIIRDNRDPELTARVAAISINVNALNHQLRRDLGRSTGLAQRIEGFRDNHGPLIVDNKLARNGLNGMVVRGQTLTTQSIWDDTNVVHILLNDTIYVPDFHTYGGLRLQSSPTESLAIKLEGANAGFTALGQPHEIDDRIGGAIQIIGQPGSPVVLTSLSDDTVGAGFEPDGNPQVDTNNDLSARRPQPGDWRSVRLERFSHDRNVEVVNETEARDVDSPGSNAEPGNAQFLGDLAPNEKSGDENRRLGFEVTGFLGDSRDRDVYSFNATGGTEVWIDIDRTTYAFDPILEVMDANGQVIASSDNSHQEAAVNDALFGVVSAPTPQTTLGGIAKPMQKTPPFQGQDFWTINPRDPGLRMVLPGPVGTNSTYHVRIRSNSPNLANLEGGLTSGAYLMQVRLREVDEVPGSTIRFADVRFADVGIDISGLPIHSPLLGEAAEDGNDNSTAASAQLLGNLLTVDRAALSVAGDLQNFADVDFYRLTVNYTDIGLSPGFFESVFDLDYADGLGRANAILSVFNSNGALILTSREGNVADDRPALPGTSDVDDLSRGSVGSSDPFIGGIELAEGTYFVAVTSDARMPGQLEQFFQRNARNPDFRLEPIPSIRRIAEDHIGVPSTAGTPSHSTFDPPQVPVLIDNNSFIPFNLSDVTLFVSADGVANNTTNIHTVDPFTGQIESNVGTTIPASRDLAIHPNGVLYTYEIGLEQSDICSPNDANSDDFLQIDPGTGQILRRGATGIITHEQDPMNPTASLVTNPCPTTRIGDGIQVQALAFGNLGLGGFAVGSRGFNDPNPVSPRSRPPGPTRFDNILYQFIADQTNANFGRFVSSPQPDRVDADPLEHLFDGAGTQIRERGELLTSPRITTVDATLVNANGTTIFNLRDGTKVRVDDGSNTRTFEYDFGFEVSQLVDGPNGITIRDGNFFALDNRIFQLDTGPVIAVNADGLTLRPGTVVTIINQNGAGTNFEFNDPMNVAAGNLPVNLATNLPSAALATNLANAINAANIGVLAAVSPNANRVSLISTSGVGGSVGVGISYGNAIRRSSFDGVPAPQLRIEGDQNAAPILQATDGSQLRDGLSFSLATQQIANNPLVFEFDAGFTLQVPITFQLQIPARGGRDITDGERFAISYDDGVAVRQTTFEFNSIAGVSGGNTPIPYNPNMSADDIAASIVTILSNANLNLSPRNLPGGVVHLGSVAGHTLDTSLSPSVPQAGQAGGVADAQTFTISDGLGPTRVFEFDSDGVFSVSANVINFTPANTADEIAALIATSVRSTTLQGVNPSAIGNGRVHLGGQRNQPGSGQPNNTLNAANSALTVIGAPGVSESPLNVAIPIVPSSTFSAAQVADAIARAVNRASIGPLVIPVPAGSQIADGQIERVNDRGALWTFEYNDVTRPPPGITMSRPIAPGCTPGAFKVCVDFVQGDANARDAQGALAPIASDSAFVIANRLRQAIDTATNFLTVQRGFPSAVDEAIRVSLFDLEASAEQVGNRVVVNGPAIRFVTGTAPISSVPIAVQVPVEEFVAPVVNTANALAQAVALSITNSGFGYSAGGRGARINIHGANTIDLSGIRVNGQQLWNDVGSTPGVSPGNEAIRAFAGDDANATALALATAINNSFGFSLAARRGNQISLISGRTTVDPPLIASGDGPGGIVTGIAVQNGTMYAVSDAGGLYVVNNPLSASASVSYVRNSSKDLLGIPFAGLTTGPPNLEGGRYANMLFAIDRSGRIYAFDAPRPGALDTTGGELQPIFADGATSIATNIPSAQGLAFSTLDRNLFHVTSNSPTVIGANDMDVRLGLSNGPGAPLTNNERQLDLGHGVNAAFDDSRTPTIGASSIHFGQGSVNNQPRSFDFAGGAHGTVVSNEFNLASYSAADRPVLYFNYYLATEEVNDNIQMRDAFRVFISDNSGDWQLLGTNNAHPDELNLGPFDVQELYDFRTTGDWRQARIPLDAYAGRSNLRLRFDFSTAADTDTGDPRTRGTELRAVAGLYLQDGDTFRIDSRTFEFDLGLSLVTPAGNNIPVGANGETMTITDGNGTTRAFRFVNSANLPANIVARPGSQFRDGDLFTVSDGTRTLSFEFDSGVVLQIPSQGAGNGGIADADTFAIDDNTADGIPAVTFEFDKDGISLGSNQRVNVADQLTILAPAAGAAVLPDGDTFVVSAGPGGPTIVFEVDKNGTVAPGNVAVNLSNNILLRIPVQGGGFGGVTDGDTFTLRFDDGVNPPTIATFEFDDNGVFTDVNMDSIPDNIRIIFDHFDSQDDIADAIANAIASSTIGLVPVSLGGGSLLLRNTTSFHTFDLTNTPSITGELRAQTQDEVADVIVATVGNPNLGLGLSPENRGNGQVVLGRTTPAHTLDTGGSLELNQSITPLTQNEVTDRLAAVIRSVLSPRVSPTKLSSGTLHIGGVQSHTLSLSANSSLLRAALPPFVVEVPDQGGASLVDGETFTIQQGNAAPVTFEFENLNVGNGVSGTNRAISFTPASTQDQIANSIVASIAAAGLGLSPINLGTGTVFIGGTDSVSNLAVNVAGTPTLSQVGQSGVSTSGGVAVPFADTDSAEQIAARIAAAVIQSTLTGVAATRINGSTVLVSGANASFDPRLTALTTEAFTPIFVDASQSPADVAERIALAVRLAFAGSITPHLGGSVNNNGTRATIDGIVNLEGAAAVTMGRGTASSFAVQGRAGANTPGNVAIPVHADMTRVQVANQIDPVLEVAFRDQTLVAENGLSYLDGDTFVLGDSNNPDVVFEFETGFVLRVPPEGGRTTPSASVPNPQGLKDGDWFRLSDGVNSARFEFDKDGTVAANSVAISIAEGSSPISVAQEIVRALQNHPLATQFGLRPRLLSGAQVQLGGRPELTLELGPQTTLSRATSAPFLLSIPAGGGNTVQGGVRDGATIRITNGVDTVTFEFESTGGVQIGNIPVPFNSNTSQQQLAQALVNAVRGMPAVLAGNLGLTPAQTTTLNGGQHVLIAGQPGSGITISNGSNISQVLPEPGVHPGISIQVPQTATMHLPSHLTLHFPAAGGGAGGILDGETFTIQIGQNVSQTFEFDRNGVVTDINRDGRPDNEIIPFTSTSTADEMALATKSAIERRRSTLGLSPTKLGGDGNVDIGATVGALTLPANSVFASTGPLALQSPVNGGAGIPDGEFFTLVVGVSSIRFEMDSNGLTIPGNVRIQYNLTDTAQQIGDKIVQAVNNQNQPVSPISISGPAGLLIGGPSNVRLLTGNSHLRQTGIAGPISDGSRFRISDGSRVATFEFDNDGIASSGTIPVVFNPDSTENQIAGEIVRRIQSEGLGLFPRHLGGGDIHLGANANHRLDTGALANVSQSGRGGGIRDGNTFAVTSGATSLTFEFDNNGVFVDANQNGLPDNRLIQFNDGQTQQQLTDLIVTSLLGAGLNVFSRNLGDGLIDLGGTSTHRIDSAGSPGLRVDGFQGANSTRIPVLYSPSSDFSPSNVASSVANAINVQRVNLNIPLNINAAIDTFDSRRVELDHSTGFTTDVRFNSPIAGQFQLGGNPLRLSPTNDIVKQHQDLFYIVNHNVIDAGPLGVERALAGDQFGVFEDFFPNDPALRGEDNVHEGVYIDDIIIGLAERGEMGTSSTNDSAYVANPLFAQNQIATGPYQLEVRRASDFVHLNRTPGAPSGQLIRSFDSNDRLVSGITMVAPAGSHLFDGRTFRISDGVNTVVFEYDDVTRGNGVTSGHQAVRYHPFDPAHRVAQSVRDAINSQQVREFIDVTAVISDGTITGTGVPAASTSNRINLSGAANLQVFSADVVEGNDSLANATATGIRGQNSPKFVGSGFIGDNPNSILRPGQDVDMFRIDLSVGETIKIDVDADAIGSDLNSLIRVFDANGSQLAVNNNRPAPGELVRLDPYLEFTAPRSGAYYVGVSGNGNSTYDPQTALSGPEGDTGFYQIELTFGAPGTSEFILANDQGDQNRLREQGQLIIQSNRITNARTFGIRVDHDAARESSSLPHPGPVRNLPELNVNAAWPNGLATGVVISNNIVALNRSGGIFIGGDQNLPGETAGPNPFDRLINNTIVGTGSGDVGVRITNRASPTLLNNVVASLSTGVFADQGATPVVGANLYQSNGTNTSGLTGAEDFAIILGPNDPLFVNAAKGNFYPARFSRAIDSSIGSLLERADFTRVKTPLGIPVSPIIGPSTDGTGLLRVDDPEVEPPAGFGDNVFIDRGAQDRADFAGPTALVLQPRDNDADGIDLNRSLSYVALPEDNVLSNFRIEFSDGVEPADPQDGTGIDDETINKSKVRVTQNGRLLQEGIDYNFSYNPISDTIRLTPLTGIWTPDRIYTVTLVNRDRFSVVASHGRTIDDADQFQITDSAGAVVTFEFDRGYSLRVPETLTLLVPPQAAGIGGIADQQRFIVQDGQRVRNFEFDSNGSVSANRIPIRFTSTSTVDDIANSIVAALANEPLGLSPRYLGNGAVLLGSLPNHVVNVTLSSLQLRGQAGGVGDNEQFSIDDGNRVVTFEFDRDGFTTDSNNDGVPDNVVIRYTAQNTNTEIGDRIAAAIQSANVGLSPVSLGNGEVHVGGTIEHILNTNRAPNLARLGEPGVRTPFGLKIPTSAGRVQGISDGDTFTISDGVNPPIIFELDSNGQTQNPTVVQFSNGQLVDELADRIVGAIQSVNLGLAPINAGGGRVFLGGTNRHSISFSNLGSSGLRQIGQPGVPAAVPVPILPINRFDGTQVAVEVIRAINNPASGLTGVQAIPAEGSEIFVEGAVNIRDLNQAFAGVTFTGAVRDLATNALKPNQLSGETRFTIVLGDVELDFGDSPDAPYATLTGSNGAAHVVHHGFHLGSDVDAESQGQPNAVATGDDNDHYLDAFHTSVTTLASPPFAIQVPVALQVSLNGSAAGGIADEMSFRLGDANRLLTFEYDGDGITQPNSIPITFTAGSTTQQIGDATVAAIRNSRLSVSATHVGNGRILLEITPIHSIDTSASAALTLSAGVADGENFTIADRFNSPVTFEFDNNGVISPGRIRIPFTAADSAEQIGNTIAATVRSVIPDAVLNPNPPQPLVGLTPASLGGGLVNLGGNFIHSIDATGSRLRAFGSPVHRLQVPETLTLQVPAAGGGTGGVLDGQRFTIRNGIVSSTFEFDTNGNTTVGNIPIAIVPTDTQEDIAAKMTNELRNATALGLSPVNLGGGIVHLGSRSSHSVDTSFSTLRAQGVAAGIDDGQDLVVSDGVRSVRFEFENIGAAVPNGVQPGRTPVNFRFSDTHVQIAASLVGAIQAAGFTQLTASNLGGGQVFLDGAPSHTVDISASSLFDSNHFPSSLQIPAAGGAVIADGETFVIKDGDQIVRFEFDRNGLVTNGNVAVPYRATDSQNEVARSLAQTVQGAGIDLLSAAVGNGIVRLVSDDEDGVLFRGIFNSFIDTEIVVTVNNTTTNQAYLDAWIDYNRDGDFTDPGEQIFASKQVANGPNVLTTRAPSDASFGTTFARFRLSSVGGLRPTGLTSEGEVEDYLIEIRPGSPPAAQDDRATTTEDATLPISVTSNDSDPDGDPLTVQSIDLTGTKGVATILSASTVVYNPNGAFDNLRIGELATDIFRYTINDGNGGLSTGTVTVTITGLNDAPKPRSDVYSTNEDAVLNVNAPGVVANDVDPEGDAFSVSVFDLVSANGAAVTISNQGQLTYDPRNALAIQQLPAGQSLVDTFTYTVSDGSASARGTVSVTVTGLNDNPIAVPDQGLTNEDTPLTTVNVLLNDVDVDTGDAVGFESGDVLSAKGATVIDNGNGTFLYDPTGADQIQRLDTNGQTTDTFTYGIIDLNGGRSRGTVTITVNGINDPPDAVDDLVSTFKNLPFIIRILDNDKDPEEGTGQLTISLDVSGTIGRVTLTPNRVINYDPNGQFDSLSSGQSATDTFTYTLTDRNGLTDTATVIVTVRGPNTPPNAVDDNVETDESTAVNIAVLLNDFDADRQPLTVESIDTTGVRGVVTLESNGTVTFDPNRQFEDLGTTETSTQVFTYRINDGDGGTDTGTVTITISGQNDPPDANADGYTMFQGASLITTDATGASTPTNLNDNGVLANDTDIDGDGLTVQLVQGPRNALTFVLNPNGTFTYAHNGSTATSDSFTYRVNDGKGASDTATVSITIQRRPPSPWRNPTSFLDVNADNSISPIDVLLIVNEINRNGAHALPNPPFPPNAPPPFFDVDNDGFVAPNDALQIVNFLNSRTGGGEGEGASDNTALFGTDVVLPDFTGPGGDEYGRRLFDAVFHEPRTARTPGVQDVSGRLTARIREQLGATFANISSSGDTNAVDGIESDAWLDEMANDDFTDESADSVFSDLDDWLA